MAKLPQNFVTFNNTEYSVCNIKNQIIVTGGRTKQNDVWIYQVRKMTEHNRYLNEIYIITITVLHRKVKNETKFVKTEAYK